MRGGELNTDLRNIKYMEMSVIYQMRALLTRPFNMVYLPFYKFCSLPKQ
jgi:hypothetical protein